MEHFLPSPINCKQFYVMLFLSYLLKEVAIASVSLPGGGTNMNVLQVLYEVVQDSIPAS